MRTISKNKDRKGGLINPSSERRQNPKTLNQLQKFRNSKSHNTVNRKLANAQTVRFTGALFRFEFLKISSERNDSFWILSLCQNSERVGNYPLFL